MPEELDLLKEVKISLGITGNFQDDLLNNFIFEVLEYLKDAGVKEEICQSKVVVGVVARGVNDLWNNDGNFSPYFMQRVTQLTYKAVN